LKTICVCPEDAIVDCSHAVSQQGLESGLPIYYLELDVLPQEALLTEHREIRHMSEEVEADFPIFIRDPDGNISGHELCAEIGRSDVWQDLAAVAVAVDGASDLSNRGKSRIFPMGPRPGRRHAFFTSAFFHSTVLCLMAFFPVAHVAGTTGTGENVIMMKVVADEDVIPQDESPASMDSTASAPSLARRDKSKNRQPPEPLQTQADNHENGPSPKEMEVKEKPKDKQDGNAQQDSIAAMASTASAERRLVRAGGQEGNALDAMVLSAIRESIFFPKNAFNQRHHGEVVVAFAINRDGSLSDLRVVKPSESAILNEAAVKIIQKAAKKFPSIPDTLFRERLDYVVPIFFKDKKG
jgi:TonB family protein